MELKDEELELLPSDEDVLFYQEHGYYISKKIFSDDQIDEAIYGSERFYAGERDFFLHPSIDLFRGWKSEDGAVMRINDYVSLQNREIASLIGSGLLGAIAARLAGSPIIRLWHDQMIFKPIGLPENKTSIGWHTDRAYWPCTSENMLSAWIPFNDCTVEMGPLEIIDGSHKWPGGDSAVLRGFHSHNLHSLKEGDSAPGHTIKPVPMILRKGQVSFHHCLVMHGSAPNLGTSPRHTLSVHLQDSSCRHREIHDEKGELIWHRNDILCRNVNGKPDYTDPDICPVLWSVESN